MSRERSVEHAPAPPTTRGAEARFRELDEYRVQREWDRYEGTGLRDLFRELRVRFLDRHAVQGPGPVLEVGPGPGRFSSYVGGVGHDRVLVDLSGTALVAARAHLSGHPVEEIGRSEFVRAHGGRLPFRSDTFAEVVLLGNTLGFAEGRSEGILTESVRVVRPGGWLLLEAVAGAGSRSRYLHRLPVGALRRLLAAPVRAVMPRIDREGFDRLERPEKPGHAFRRWSLEEVERTLVRSGFRVQESIAVAPLLGDSPDRPGAVRQDPKAWAHLLALEEEFGRRPALLKTAAAYLVAAQRVAPPPQPMG